MKTQVAAVLVTASVRMVPVPYLRTLWNEAKDQLALLTITCILCVVSRSSPRRARRGSALPTASWIHIRKMPRPLPLGLRVVIRSHALRSTRRAQDMAYGPRSIIMGPRPPRAGTRLICRSHA